MISSKIDESDKLKKFENEGVIFKAKLIGSELVMEPRGDKMCQNSIQRLKAIIKGTNSHKKRIVLKISFDGVKVYDEKTNEMLHHHEVSQISYIASDDTDTRTFGYVSDVANKAHQFICFKTIGPAITVMSTMSALFEAVQERKSQVEKIVVPDDLIGLTSTPGSVPIIKSLAPSHNSSLVSLPRPAPVAKSSATSHNRSLVYNHSSVSLSDAALTRQSSYTSSPQTPNDSYVDRYAVFNDIDSMPSIFESFSLHNVNKASSISVTPLVPALSSSNAESSMFRQRNPFDDDFFA